MRLLCLTLCVVFPPLMAGAGFYPSFPEGWKDRADPRFQPRIEEVARSLSFFPTKGDLQDAQSAWGRWGPEAIPIVLRLRSAPDWSSFQHAFTVLLCICPLAEASTVRESLFYDTLQGETGRLRSTRSTHNYLAVFTKYNAPKATELLLNLANQENPLLRLLSASWLQRLGDRHRPKVDQILNTYYDSDDIELRKRVVELLMARVTRQDCARALSIAKTISAEYHATIGAQIAKLDEQLRAAEPMQDILEQEERFADR
ncbi:MAG: hypothetical protein KF886_24495 [Candidatus Hydrogenedentes bacterium]|nr:hypothetical protein [Candidatus Hydrogenedentota bacterium]